MSETDLKDILKRIFLWTQFQTLLIVLVSVFWICSLVLHYFRYGDELKEQIRIAEEIKQTLEAGNSIGLQLESPPLSWRIVNDEIERGEFASAISKAELLLEKAPGDYTGHRILALTHLKAGNLEEAQLAADKSFKLWPNESGEEFRKIIKKRIEIDSHKEVLTEQVGGTQD